MNSKINKIIATEVVVHAREGYVDRPAFGPSIFDKPSKWMLEVFTDDGLVGFGETARSTSGGDVEQCARQLLGKSLRSISWRNPINADLSSSDLFGHVNPPVPNRLYERSSSLSSGGQACEIAILDLLGKLFELPLYQFLGGAHREWIPTSWWMGRSDSEHAARQMEIGLELGFTDIKFKATAEDDVPGIIQAIQKVAGRKALIAIDPNQRFYRLSEAIRIAHQVEDANVMFEDPFPFDIEEWRLFRQKTSVPLALHGGKLHEALANHCCDHVNLGRPAWRFMSQAHMAAQFGALCWAGSGVELGIIDTYILHYSAATPTCVLPGDAIGHCIREDDLLEDELVVKDGSIRLPEGNGLGVTLDQKALQKYGRSRMEFE